MRLTTPNTWILSSSSGLGTYKCFAKGIERAGTDIAEHNTNRASSQLCNGTSLLARTVRLDYAIAFSVSVVSSIQTLIAVLAFP